MIHIITVVRNALQQAQLYLNNAYVGDVYVRGWEGSWGFGDFQPNDRFSEFSLIFGRWSLLMHAADDDRDISDAASDELRQAEYDLDRLKARLFLDRSKEWRDIGQLNIDGKLIEWKERWPSSAR